MCVNESGASLYFHFFLKASHMCLFLSIFNNTERLSLENTFLTGRVPDSVCELREDGALQEFSTECPTRREGVVCAIPTCCTDCKRT